MDYMTPEIRHLIDTTADFVAQHGIGLEATIQEKERNNPKFSFFRPNDPFYSYYQSVLKQRQALHPNVNAAILQQQSNESNNVPEIVEKEDTKRVISIAEQPAKRGLNTLSQRMIDVNRRVKANQMNLTQLPNHYIADLPEGITALDLDVMKLTAQFVARNGHNFQKGLWDREHKNPQFEFLRPSHPYHNFFVKHLVESYVRCLNPPRDIAAAIKKDFPERNETLDRIIAQYQASKEEEEQRRRELEANDETSAAIDWHDFVVVYTIDFQDEQAAAPEMEQPSANVGVEDDQDVEMETDEMEVEEEEPVMRRPTEINIRRDYVKGSNQPEAKIQYQKCPKCHNDIPVNEMQEHMRIELMDAKYKEQRALQAERTRGAADFIAGDDEIGRNLSALARKRLDVFGDNTTIEIPKEDPKSDKVQWDGFSSSIGQTTLQAQMKASNEPPVLAPPPVNLSGPSLAPSVPTLYQVPQLLPQPVIPNLNQPSFVPPPPSLTMPQHPSSTASQSYPPPPPLEDEPSSKRPKVEESNLAAEEDFLKKYPSKYTIQIRVPDDNSKAEWKLKGQTLSLDVNGKDLVSQLKERIKDLVGLPANKQKLQIASIPNLVDAKTVAFYNLAPQSVVDLRLKARGGKK
eukprot:TRINITY_DN2796_c0_g1_i1.p1 TRINITY_DN2796_c0_g1~~TRINITY_DN2796_c0_g1_i1.p1  ORF type:complete len:631 (+),score=218.91 TRINITY_DN2796_c0_g1_i1:137-2029(+)